MTHARSKPGSLETEHAPVVVRNLTVPLNGVPSEVAGLRIAHVSDFHFRHWTRVTQMTRDLLLRLDIDLLVVTGDLGAWRPRWRKAASLARRFFQPLAERRPIYAVLGNHDDPRLAAPGEIPVQFLRNEARLVRCGKAVVELIGLDQSSSGTENLDAALGAGREGNLSILLAHYPSTVYRLPPARVHLQLSGHTHGGQIRLPWLGCIWPNDAISPHMARGLHLVGNTYLHVSPGIGVSPPIPLRINCPPEISLLELAPVEVSPTSESDPAYRATPESATQIQV